VRHWALPAAPSAEQANAESPFRDAIIELPDWLAEQLANETPVTGDILHMPDDDADLSLLASWPRHDGDFPLWPENQWIYDFFAALATQWQHAGMDGMKTGIPFQSIDCLAARKRVQLTDDGWDELQICEATALSAWAQQRTADQEKAKTK
jgi:hypothetical protein